jgi:hypothetical protein
MGDWIQKHESIEQLGGIWRKALILRWKTVGPLIDWTK